jgi:hypothetical protein
MQDITPEDFENFRNSVFYQMGLIRLEVSNLSHFDAQGGTCIYDFMHVPTIDEVENGFQTIGSKQSYLVPVVRMLGMKVDDTQISLPESIKKEIIKQYKEVAEAMEIVKQQYFEKNGKQLPIRRQAFLICPPGGWAPIHGHHCTHSVTFVYTYPQGKIEGDEESCLKMGYDLRHTLPFPKENKLLFSFKDNPFHSNVNNEWRFFWINDFDDYFELPKDLNYYYWIDKYHDKNNL